MGSDELLPGEKTPTRGSGSSRRQKLKEETSSDVKEGMINGKDIHLDNGKKEDADESVDDESFVTMEEIKEGQDAGMDKDFYSKLGYEDMAVDAFTQKRPSNISDRARRVSHRFSRELVRRRSSLIESFPETPAGWSVLVSALASAVLGYELHLQQSLSCAPWVFGQCGGPLQSNSNNLKHEQLPLQPIYDKLTETPNSLLSRPIEPSLFVGTRGTLSSVAAYALHGPPKTDQHVSFRQVLTMAADGAQIALDWELPPQTKLTDDEATQSTTPRPTPRMTDQQRIQHVQTKGAIQKPVILILTGMNNDTSFGYIKSLQRTFTDRGWIAVAMNFRGCGGVKLKTPRCYNGGYTGDLRGVVQYLTSRLATSPKKVPLFIVGNSLSANLVTKYLGEEGLSGTLPPCVAGGVSLGNPLLMHANNLSSPWQEVLALGVKKDLLLNWPSFRHMTVPSYRAAIYNTLFKAKTIGEVDEALAPIFIRNESYYPFAVRIGFENAEDYWADSSSFKYIKHISVPCLQIVAGDDMIVYKSFQKKLAHCVQNPYVMCVETKCGGHLGWQESPPDSNAFGVGPSWADRATADFFDAILQTGTFDYNPTTTANLETDATTSSHEMAQGGNEAVSHQQQSHADDNDNNELPRFRAKL